MTDAACLALVLAASPDAVVVADARGRVLRLNAEATRCLGWTDDDVRAGLRLAALEPDAAGPTPDDAAGDAAVRLRCRDGATLRVLRRIAAGPDGQVRVYSPARAELGERLAATAALVAAARPPARLADDVAELALAHTVALAHLDLAGGDDPHVATALAHLDHARPLVHTLAHAAAAWKENR